MDTQPLMSVCFARFLACKPGAGRSGGGGDGGHHCGHHLLDRLVDRLGCSVALDDLRRPRPKLPPGQALLPAGDDLVLYLRLGFHSRGTRRPIKYRAISRLASHDPQSAAAFD